MAGRIGWILLGATLLWPFSFSRSELVSCSMARTSVRKSPWERWQVSGLLSDLGIEVSPEIQRRLNGFEWDIEMLDGLKDRLRKHEGVIDFMYLDTLGYCTTGVGHLLINAASARGLPWVRRDGSLAGAEEVSAEYERTLKLEKAHLPNYYERNTSLRLTPEAVADLLDRDVAQMSAALVALLPGFGEFPEPCQEALLDMAFQLGPVGLVHGFPQLMHCVRSGDWNGCAVNCHRAGIQPWRNEATADLFRQAVNA